MAVDYYSKFFSEQHNTSRCRQCKLASQMKPCNPCPRPPNDKEQMLVSFWRIAPQRDHPLKGVHKITDDGNRKELGGGSHRGPVLFRSSPTPNVSGGVRCRC